MTNQQVVQAFLKGNQGKSLNMKTDGKRLFSYNTVIAQHCTDGLTVNMTRYSVTTSKQRNYVIREMQHSNFNSVYNIPIGAHDLTLR